MEKQSCQTCKKKFFFFVARDKISKTLLNKAKKSAYEKDNVFYNFYKNQKMKMFYTKVENI